MLSGFETAPIEAIHDPGLLRFLTTAWAEYQAANGDPVARLVRWSLYDAAEGQREFC